MNLVDVNVLVYARRRDSERHDDYRAWLSEALGAAEPMAITSHTLAASLRILTHPRIWNAPLSTEESLEYGSTIRSAPATILLDAGERHWEIFSTLCRDAGVRGNLIMDAWLAALAIEHNCVLVSADRDFARFRGLRWQHPLDKG